jgi:hypothetical protein
MCAQLLELQQHQRVMRDSKHKRMSKKCASEVKFRAMRSILNRNKHEDRKTVRDVATSRTIQKKKAIKTQLTSET